MPNICILSQEKWIVMPVSGWEGPGTARGCCRERHRWARYHSAGQAAAVWGFTSCLKGSLSLPCVLHLTIVQKCALQVWKLNIRLEFAINLSPVHMGTRWGRFGCLKLNPSSEICLPSRHKEWESGFPRMLLERGLPWMHKMAEGAGRRVWHGFPSEALS